MPLPGTGSSDIPGGGGDGIFSTSRTDLAEAEIAITSPRGPRVGPGFRVEGTAFVRMHTSEFIKAGNQGHHFSYDSYVTEGFSVTVRVGDDVRAAHVSRQGDRLGWSSEVDDPAADRLTITASLDGFVEESQSTTIGGRPEHHTETESVHRTDSVDVVVDRDGPTVSASIQDVTIGPPYRATIEGRSEDPAGVESVRWHLGSLSGGAENSSGDWSSWRAVVPVPDRTRAHRIMISARDEVGNDRPDAAHVTISPDEESPTVTMTWPLSSPRLELWQEGGINVLVQGTADDSDSVIETVKWRLDDGPEAEAEPTGDTWSAWRLIAGIGNPGQHFIHVWAVDLAGNASDSIIIQHDKSTIEALEVRVQVLSVH